MKKSVILSDFFQSGMPAELVYQKIVSLLTQKKINRLIGIGNEMMKHKHLFTPIEDVMFFASTDDFINQFNILSFREESILLKGARLFQFEKISSLLEQKIHETILEINLNALRSNLKKYQYALGQHIKIMAMVKAFSYGSGSFEIANMLQHEGVEYLAVAYTDEGVELRKAGIRLPIMVMNPTISSFHNLCKHQLEPELYSFDVMDSFLHFLQQKNIKDYPVHLKLDTGMHRLGFLSADIEQLCVLLNNQKFIQIKSVFSHLVASEDPSQDDFTLHQADLFMKMSESIEKAVGYPFLKHLSNTAAIRRHPGLQLDMVRLGIGLYGVDGINDLSNVTTLKTTIAQIKKIKKGETVGYGRKGKVNRDSVIATVRIGYADGYPRILGNGTGKMLIHDQAVPVIGNVCMDMTMLDITDIEAIVGDEVIVFGKNLSVKTIAEWANTIPYEILTGISQRVKRIYYEE
ncbi:MAG: alanine racemase [Ferruginibacter sp.]|nr:alanine racemase [Ferruginibacter sp.]